MSTTINGNGEIDTPNSDKGLDIGGMMSFDNFMHIQDQKPAGIAGGASVTAGVTRDLNTVLTNTITGASLSANIVTLPIGTYYFDIRAPSYASYQATLFLDNATTTLLISSNMHTAVASSDVCLLTGVLTFTSIENLHLVQKSRNATVTGLGMLSSAYYTLPYELYTDMKIWKVG